MRIDGTQGVGHQGHPEPKPASAAGPGPSVKGDGGAMAPSAELVSSHASQIRKAIQAEEVDAQAVEQARQLLQSGKLFSLDAIRRAAQALLDEGV